MRRRGGGLFVGVFLTTGAVQAVTGFVPGVPSIPAAVSSAKASDESSKFTGTSAPIKPGSVPVKRWEELINKWGNKCKALTPAILAAQLHQESMGFNMKVVSGDIDSPVGARGISQFMPATWKTEGLDANRDGEANILDPEDSIPSTATFDCKLAKGTRNVPGNPIDNMLAGYNAGGNKVLKYQGVPPYKETQNYVRIIKDKAGRFENK